MRRRTNDELDGDRESVALRSFWAPTCADRGDEPGLRRNRLAIG
jgi:hypothetical protein